MLIYVDESWVPAPKGDSSHFTLAAAAISEDAHKAFNTGLYKLKERFNRSGTNTFEIKGRNLLKPGFQAYPRNIEITKDIISLCRLHDVTLFAIVEQYAIGQEKANLALDDPQPGLKDGEILLGRLYKFLIERVQAYIVEHPSHDFGILVFDQKDLKKDEARARAFTNFMYRSMQGREMANIVETAFFVSSAITPGIQVADLFAYIINQFMEGRKDLKDFFDEISQLQFISSDPFSETPLKGIRYLKAKGQF